MRYFFFSYYYNNEYTQGGEVRTGYGNFSTKYKTFPPIVELKKLASDTNHDIVSSKNVVIINWHEFTNKADYEDFIFTESDH